MKLNYKLLLYLPILFLFFPAFVFYIPTLKATYLVFFILLYIILVALFIKDRNKLIRKIRDLIKITPLKYYIIFLLLITINAIFLCFLGYSNYLQAFRSIFMQIILFVCPIIIYFTYIIDKYITFEKFIQIFILFFWIVLILGFVAYIGQFYNIEVINNVFDFFANARILKVKQGLDAQLVTSNYVAFGLPRLDNLQEEPSHYARFLYIFLPFVYTFGNTKLKLFQNIFVDKLIKRTLILFTWISILLTLSPMYLVISSILTIIFYLKSTLIIIKKYNILIISFLFVLIISLSHINLSETFISRILNLIGNIHSFQDLIYIEPSLATRIIVFINTFCIFLSHPILGVGLGNSLNFIYQQYLHSPLPLTMEIVSKTSITMPSSGKPFFNTNLLSMMLAENGIFITLVFLYFYFKLLFLINKLIKIKKEELSIDFLIAKSIQGTLYAIIFLFFYDYAFLKIELHFIFALAIAYIWRCYAYTNSKILKL